MKSLKIIKNIKSFVSTALGQNKNKFSFCLAYFLPCFARQRKFPFENQEKNKAVCFSPSLVKIKNNLFLFLNLILLTFVYKNVLAVGETIPADSSGTAVEVFGAIKRIIEAAIPILMVAATAVFIWGIIQYVLAGGSDTRKKEAKNLIIWGLVGLTVVAGAWSITVVLSNTFGISVLGTPREPGIPGTFEN